MTSTNTTMTSAPSFSSSSTAADSSVAATDAAPQQSSSSWVSLFASESSQNLPNLLDMQNDDSMKSSSANQETGEDLRKSNSSVASSVRKSRRAKAAGDKTRQQSQSHHHRHQQQKHHQKPHRRQNRTNNNRYPSSSQTRPHSHHQQANRQQLQNLKEAVADRDGQGQWELTGKAKKEYQRIVQKKQHHNNRQQQKQNSRRKKQAAGAEKKTASESGSVGSSSSKLASKSKNKTAASAVSDQDEKKQASAAIPSAQVNAGFSFAAAAQSAQPEPELPTPSEDETTVEASANEDTTPQEVSEESSNPAESTSSTQLSQDTKSKKKRKKSSRTALLTEIIKPHLSFDSILKHERPSEIKNPMGLHNMHNTCFVNSVIQPLMYLPHFQELLHRLYEKRLDPEKYQLFYAFWNLFQEMKRNKNKNASASIIPEELIRVLSEKQNTMRLGGEQNDAQEFMLTCLEALHKELLPVRTNASESSAGGNRQSSQNTFQVEDDGWEEVGKGNKSSVVQEVSTTPSSISHLFCGTMRSMLRKRNQKASLTLQPFYCVHLPIDSVHTIKEAFKLMTVKESLQSGVSQQITFEELPPVLVIHLNRFSHNLRTGETHKISRHISFEEDLYIDESILGKAQKPLNSKKRNYTLHSVTEHHGQNVGNGHYSSMVRYSKDSWYKFDDEATTLKTTPECLSSVAYLLIYIRGD